MPVRSIQRYYKDIFGDQKNTDNDQRYHGLKLRKKKTHQKLKQYITFNFIIELKEKLTYSYPMLCYSQQ